MGYCVAAASEKQVNAFKAAIADEKRNNGQLKVLNSMANEKAAQLEAALAAEQNRVSDLSGKITFYGDAYQKLQGKLTGVCSLAFKRSNLSLRNFGRPIVVVSQIRLTCGEKKRGKWKFVREWR